MTPLRRSAWLLALLGALRLCDPANQIFETSIAVDGVELPLRLFEGQTVVTAAANFVLEHGLIAPSQEPMASLLVAQLAEALRERVASAADAAPAHAAERVTGAPAPLLTVTVAVDGRDHVFEFFAGADPVRAAHNFCGKLGVNAVAHSRCRKQLVDEVVAQLARRKPLVDAPKDERQTCAVGMSRLGFSRHGAIREASRRTFLRHEHASPGLTLNQGFAATSPRDDENVASRLDLQHFFGVRFCPVSQWR